ncbi:MAG: TrbI/VirB10 family protein [Rickettsiales bacterium]
MDNNTPPSNEENNLETSASSTPREAGDEADFEIVNSPFNNKKNPTAMIAVGAVIAVISIYAFYSIFSSPPPAEPISPMAGQGGDKLINVAPDNGTPENVGDGIGEMDMTVAPPVSMIPPPPPPESTIYVPPPMVMPPMAQPSQAIITPPSSSNIISNSDSSGNIFEEPPPPPPPAPPAPLPTLSGIGKTSGVNLKDDESKKRLKSNMLVIDGGVGSASSVGGSNSELRDRNAIFAESAIRSSKADKAIATGLNNLNMTIAQGKIINAVLETAINTDLPGTLRAIVSRDTYAEAGRDVLIPKGSRLIGTYNTDLFQGQSRVMIVWTRMIRPDGIDIEIGSSAVDGLGRAGISGHIDNKFTEIFSAAIMTTALSIAGAVAVEAVLPTENNSTTTTPEGNTTTTASPAQTAAGSALTGLVQTSKDVVDKIVDTRPTITIDQGTLINVFVNRDLTFPSNINGGMFIQ